MKHPIQAPMLKLEIEKRLSVCLAISILLVTCMLISNWITPHIRSHELNILIRAGRFESSALTTAEINSNMVFQAIVKANTPITVSYTSCDYVYTVQQSDTKQAVVVLPNVTVVMPMTFEVGKWSFSLLQGCGSFSPEHTQSFTVKAVE